MDFGALVNIMTPTDNEPILVNVDNFVRAETDFQFERAVKNAGGINRWAHNRQPTPLDKQFVIRMNRDTLYSSAIVDLSEGAAFTIPEAGDRYLSVMVINQDHYLNRVYYEAGTHELSIKEFHTPYAMVSARILVDPKNAADVKKANTLQDQFGLDSSSAKPFVVPNYDKESYMKTRELIMGLAKCTCSCFCRA